MGNSRSVPVPSGENLAVINNSNNKHNGGCGKAAHGGHFGPTSVQGSHDYMNRVIQKRTISQPTLKSRIFPNIGEDKLYRATLYNHKTGNKIMGKAQRPADSSTRTRFLGVFGGYVVKPGQQSGTSTNY
mgnify:FL=1